MAYHRLPLHNYRSRCIYMITMVTTNRQRLFGSLAGDERNAHVEYTELGKRINTAIEAIPTYYPQIRVLSKQVMPDHVHFVLFVTEELPVALGTVIRGFKLGCNRTYRALRLESAGQGHPQTAERHPQTPNQEPHPQVLETAAFQAAQTPLLSLFEDGFHDRILSGKNQLNAMIRYIYDNPRRAIIKRLHPDLFRMRHNVTRTIKGIHLSFRMLGNPFLLDYPIKQAVQCSRSLTEEQIQALLHHVLQAAGQGCITYTASISHGEQVIARTIREQGFPLIVLLKDGFPKEGDANERFYKPNGVYFEACAKGQLLLLEPTEQTVQDAHLQHLTEQALQRKATEKHLTYTTLPTSSDRFRMMQLNIITELLTALETD